MRPLKAAKQGSEGVSDDGGSSYSSMESCGISRNGRRPWNTSSSNGSSFPFTDPKKSSVQAENGKIPAKMTESQRTSVGNEFSPKNYVKKPLLCSEKPIPSPQKSVETLTKKYVTEEFNVEVGNTTDSKISSLAQSDETIDKYVDVGTFQIEEDQEEEKTQ